MSPAELSMKRDELADRLEGLRESLSEDAAPADQDQVTQEVRDTQLRENIQLLENRISDIDQKLEALDDQD